MSRSDSRQLTERQRKSLAAAVRSGVSVDELHASGRFGVSHSTLARIADEEGAPRVTIAKPKTAEEVRKAQERIAQGWQERNKERMATVLRLLAAGREMQASALVRASGGVLKTSHAYEVLDRMVQQGLIAVRVMPMPAASARRLYRVAKTPP